MVQHWIDHDAGVARLVVQGQLTGFREFLNAIDRLTAAPAWRAGMPVLEDLRDCDWTPPPSAVSEWRDYVAARAAQFEGCRWAVVTRGDNVIVEFILDSATSDAASAGLALQHFSTIEAAHRWLRQTADEMTDAEWTAEVAAAVRGTGWFVSHAACVPDSTSCYAVLMEYVGRRRSMRITVNRLHFPTRETRRVEINRQIANGAPRDC